MQSRVRNSILTLIKIKCLPDYPGLPVKPESLYPPGHNKRKGRKKTQWSSVLFGGVASVHSGISSSPSLKRRSLFELNGSGFKKYIYHLVGYETTLQFSKSLATWSQLARQHATSNGTCWRASTLQLSHRRHSPVRSDFCHIPRRHPDQVQLRPNTDSGNQLF
jgi:hypothetical protein